MAVDITIPTDVDDPMVVKEHALKLQNYLPELGKYMNAYQYMVEQCDAELSRLRDKSLVDASYTEGLEKKHNEIKKSYGKVNLKYKVEITSPLRNDRHCQDIKGEYTYDELKKLYAFLNYRYGRARTKWNEVKSAIETCNFYPVKVYQ